MKIVYLIDQLYKHGGIEKILSQKLNYLLNNTTLEIILITVNQQQKPFVYSVHPNIKHYDLNINYNTKQSYFHPSNWFILLTHFIKLRKLFKDISPDVAVSVQFFPDQYFLPFLKTKKTIKEIHFMGEAINSGLNRIDRYLFGKLISKFSHLVLLNNDEKTFYSKFNYIAIIPNFVTKQSVQNQINKRNKTILSAGRLAPVKQFHHVIQSFSMIAKKYPDWCLEIYGSENGIKVVELNEIIKKNDVQNQVFIHGAVSDLNKIMEKSSIFALTSITECFPMVLLEAQQAGLPIVSYDCKFGPRNIVHHLEDGLLVNDQDINDFANKLEELINNEALRNQMSDKAIQNVKLFEEEKIMKMWINLFES